MGDEGLIVSACSQKAATHSVMKWHYSQSMPAGKLITYGVWNNKKFAGSIIYGQGANNRLGQTYDLDIIEVCELVRVALKPKHTFLTSQVVAMSLASLRKDNPGLRLVVSYADTNQNHHGGIYQAMNWIYTGESLAASMIIKGKKRHTRSVSAKYGTSKLEWLQKNVDPKAHLVKDLAKHKYLMPLDKQMRRQVIKLVKPYPKKVKEQGVQSL